jgi:NAD(P)-dependent dehydrogenase (short-subunit alcohol dehydrogenase family)
VTQSPRVWFITGSSSGFGRSLTELALARDERVVATARKVASLQDFVAAHRERVCAVKLDVTRPAEVRAAIDRAREVFGRIDVLVNNAGYGLQGAVEDVTDAHIRAVFETNVFGAIDVTRAALPLLRTQRSGHIINISSVGGRLSMPLVGLYSATKFALEGFSIALAQEMRPLGIKVTLIEPGAFATRFGSPESLVSVPTSAPYAPLGEAIAAALASFQWGEPRGVAEAILEVCDAKEPPLQLVLSEQAMGMVRQTLNAQLAELSRWQALSIKASPA